MTKDEAWKAHVDAVEKLHMRCCFEAGWEAALAETLGMLESVVGLNEDDLITKEPGNFSYELVIIRRGDGSLLYRDRNSDQDLSRAEAEALLKGDAADADA